MVTATGKLTWLPRVLVFMKQVIGKLTGQYFHIHWASTVLKKRNFPPRNRQNNFSCSIWDKFFSASVLRSEFCIHWFQKISDYYHLGEFLDLFRGGKFLFLTPVGTLSNLASFITHTENVRRFDWLKSMLKDTWPGFSYQSVLYSYLLELSSLLDVSNDARIILSRYPAYAFGIDVNAFQQIVNHHAKQLYTNHKRLVALRDISRFARFVLAARIIYKRHLAHVSPIQVQNGQKWKIVPNCQTPWYKKAIKPPFFIILHECLMDITSKFYFFFHLEKFPTLAESLS